MAHLPCDIVAIFWGEQVGSKNLDTGGRNRGRSCPQVGKERDAAARNPLHCCLEEEEEAGSHYKVLAPSWPGSLRY